MSKFNFFNDETIPKKKKAVKNKEKKPKNKKEVITDQTVARRVIETTSLIDVKNWLSNFDMQEARFFGLIRPKLTIFVNDSPSGSILEVLSVTNSMRGRHDDCMIHAARTIPMSKKDGIKDVLQGIGSLGLYSEPVVVRYYQNVFPVTARRIVKAPFFSFQPNEVMLIAGRPESYSAYLNDEFVFSSNPYEIDGSVVRA